MRMRVTRKGGAIGHQVRGDNKKEQIPA